jgi:outer membrane protein assembly factor BamB
MHRRSSLLVVALVVALALSSCEWGQPRFGPDRTGFNPGETAVGVGNVASLEKAWSAPIEPATPDVEVLKAHSRVFAVANSDNLVDGSSVTALDARTGARLWSRKFPSLGDPEFIAANVSITSWRDTLIVGRSFGTSPGELTALDMATGATKWTSGSGFVFVEPVVSGDVVYAGYAELFFGSGVAAFDVKTGELLFRSLDPVLFPSSVAISGNRVYVGRGPALEVYDAAGCGAGVEICAPLWRATFPPPTGTTIGTGMPSVANGIVYVGTGDHKLQAFPAGGCGAPTCAPLWTAAVGEEIAGSPAVAGGVVYVTTTNGTLSAFRAAGCGAATCTPLWTGGTPGFTRGAPAIANGVAYVPGGDDTVQAYDAAGCGAATCKPLWSRPLGPSDGSPIVTGGRVYAGSAGLVTAFALPAG